MNAGNIQTQDAINFRNTDQGKMVQSKIKHSASLDKMYARCDLRF